MKISPEKKSRLFSKMTKFLKFLFRPRSFQRRPLHANERNKEALKYTVVVIIQEGSFERSFKENSSLHGQSMSFGCLVHDIRRNMPAPWPSD